MLSQEAKKQELENIHVLVEEYNDVVLGLRKTVHSSKITNEQLVALARHVFEYYLQWTPKDIENRLTYELLEKLHLRTLLNERFEFPHELNSKKDCFYYAHLLYPNQIGYDLRIQIIRIYQSILKGNRKTYPLNFFSDDYALERAEICLQEALKSKSFQSIYDLYHFFASSEANKFISDMKLSKPMQAYYKTPLVFLHNALSENLQSSLWYNYFIFLGNYKK